MTTKLTMELDDIGLERLKAIARNGKFITKNDLESLGVKAPSDWSEDFRLEFPDMMDVIAELEETK